MKSAQRRRAMEFSRARMMDSVPSADVIVTNPTHYSVALKYEAGSEAPVVVAKVWTTSPSRSARSRRSTG